MQLGKNIIIKLNLIKFKTYTFVFRFWVHSLHITAKKIPIVQNLFCIYVNFCCYYKKKLISIIITIFKFKYFFFSSRQLWVRSSTSVSKLLAYCSILDSRLSKMLELLLSLFTQTWSVAAFVHLEVILTKKRKIDMFPLSPQQISPATIIAWGTFTRS